MHVEEHPISSIYPYRNNPRLNAAAVDAVAASIRAFGFQQPIVVDKDGIIVVGHTRYLAALKLGLKTVPVHVAVGLTPAQVKAYRIADNAVALLSQFDDSKLVVELAALQDMDFDLSLTGLSADELQCLLEPPSEAPPEDPGPRIDRATELQAKWGTASPMTCTVASARCSPCREAGWSPLVLRGVGGRKHLGARHDHRRRVPTHPGGVPGRRAPVPG